VKRYLLDTDTASYVIRRRPRAVARRFARLKAGQLCLSIVSEAELRFGVARRGDVAALAAEVDDFLARLSVLDWDRPAARHYADIRASLETRGEPVGNLDLMIAAHARAAGAVLVTNNERHFRRIPHLAVENWVPAD
jgi:tRNA(fMet)-specific endonuclease VapC